MSTEVVYLSKRGMKELKKQIASLDRILHAANAELRELDKTDSHEGRLNRIEALSRIEVLETDLKEKRDQLERAKLLPRKRDALRVALGSVVDLIDTNGRMMRYTIVNSIEANPSDGRISVNSPLGKTLLGRSATETVELNTGRQANRLQLVRIG